ncbi:MAG: hypothetical protein L7F78_13075, partial [Syntrophales bacterium LBB04]|nr:hypothetical protein [Syntrophales bacterium LBB04]
MKKTPFFYLVLLLFLTISYRPVCASTIPADNSIWVYLESGVAPDHFQEMRIFWPLMGDGALPDYMSLKLFAPASSGWEGPAYAEDQFENLDLRYFQKQGLLVEI